MLLHVSSHTSETVMLCTVSDPGNVQAYCNTAHYLLSSHLLYARISVQNMLSVVLHWRESWFVT